MKKLLVMLFSAAFVACGQQPKSADSGQESIRNGVEVISFHAKKRCPTCIAIERLTREVIESEFAAQLADSTLVLRIVDITDNGELADRYEVTWSSLLVNRHDDGQESVNDLTQFAFANARTNPEKFKAGLKAEIEKLLAE